MVKTHIVLQNRYYNSGLIWNYGFGGTYQQYLDEIGVEMDESFRTKLDKIDDKKRTYNINKYDFVFKLKLIFYDYSVLTE